MKEEQAYSGENFPLRTGIGTLLGKVAFVLVCSVITLSGCQAARQNFYRSSTSQVRFFYFDPEAATVCVTGDFNNWSRTANCLSRKGDYWSAEMELQPGRYQYNFLIDGSVQRLDPGAPRELDGFGSENSVLVME